MTRSVLRPAAALRSPARVPSRRSTARAAALALTGALAPALPLSALAADTAPPPAGEALTLPRVDVVGTSPLGGAQPVDRVPAAVQTVNARQLRERGALNLAELFGGHLRGVNVNETQGNPWQLEVNYRGFTASPLLGVPQGLSVFVDGVRVNEAFGDVVNWELIPRNAIAGLTLHPGSDPVFGLNTLGGAIAVDLKRGDRDPGTEAGLGVGSHGRRLLELSHGRRWGEGGHLFLALTRAQDAGWRDFSPSALNQAFVRAGQDGGAFRWDLGLTAARTELTGNGLLPVSLLAARRSQVYTRPDRTEHALGALNLLLGWRLGPGSELQLRLSDRRLDAETLNGDLNDDYDPPTVPESGVENATESRQRQRGLTLAWTTEAPGRQTTVGLALERARTRFEQTEAEGMLDATRQVVDTEEEETDALIRGRSRSQALYARSVLEVSPGAHLTLSGRWQQVRVTTVDLGRAELGLPTTLDGDATYRRFNPAAGLSLALSPTLSAYGGLSQGSRAPSPIELGCSDPENACVLPNALQSDPPLKQVVTTTWEAGLRGRLDAPGTWRWNLGLFRADNRDDLLFISNGRAAGYFANVARTRRQGLEAGLEGRHGPWDLSASLALVQASFRSTACLVAESNSTAETDAACPGDDEIAVRPGDRLPGIAARQFKLEAGWRPGADWRLSAHWVAQSGVSLRGNENGRHEADGTAFVGAGRTAGFGVLNLGLQWTPRPDWRVDLRVNNALARNYATGGALAENAFDAQGRLQAPADWRHEAFLAPSAPRSLHLGLNLRFD